PDVGSFWLSPDASLLAACSGTSGEVLRIVDVKTGKNGPLLGGHDTAVIDVTFAPDGRTLVSRTDKAEARLWALDTGKVIADLTKGSQYSFTPDGKWLLCGCDHTIELREPASGKVLKTIPDAVGSYQLSPDGRLLAFPQRERRVS